MLVSEMQQEDDDGEGWITCTKDIQAGTLAPAANNKGNDTLEKVAGPPNSQRTACTTTDFAMQNVNLVTPRLLTPRYGKTEAPEPNGNRKPNQFGTGTGGWAPWDPRDPCDPWDHMGPMVPGKLGTRTGRNRKWNREPAELELAGVCLLVCPQVCRGGVAPRAARPGALVPLPRHAAP